MESVERDKPYWTLWNQHSICHLFEVTNELSGMNDLNVEEEAEKRQKCWMSNRSAEKLCKRLWIMTRTGRTTRFDTNPAEPNRTNLMNKRWRQIRQLTSCSWPRAKCVCVYEIDRQKQNTKNTKHQLPKGLQLRILLVIFAGWAIGLGFQLKRKENKAKLQINTKNKERQATT